MPSRSTSKQLKLPLKSKSPRDHHGGSTPYGSQGRRKEARPHNPKLPLHVVLRSSRARGNWSLLSLKHRFQLEQLARTLAAQWGVRIYRFVNVGNHLHLVVLAPSLQSRARFFKAFSGLSARLVTGACKGNKVGRFWDALLFSRVVRWGRDYANLCEYILKNAFESLGLISRKNSRAFPAFNAALTQLLQTGVWCAGAGPPGQS